MSATFWNMRRRKAAEAKAAQEVAPKATPKATQVEAHEPKRRKASTKEVVKGE